MKRKKEGMGFFLFVFFRTPREQKRALEMKNRRGEKKNSIENFEDKIEGIS